MIEIPSSSGQTHNSMMIDFTIRSINTNNSLAKHLDKVLSKVPQARPKTNQLKSTLNTTFTKMIAKTPIELDIKTKQKTNTLPAYHDVKHRTMTRQLRIRYKQPRSPMPRFQTPDHFIGLDESNDLKKSFFNGKEESNNYELQLSHILSSTPSVFVYQERPNTSYKKRNTNSSTIKQPLPSASILPKEFVTKEDANITTFTTLEETVYNTTITQPYKSPANKVSSPSKKFFFGRLEPSVPVHFPADLPEYEIVTLKDGPSLRLKRETHQRNASYSKPKQLRINTVTLTTDSIMQTQESTKNGSTSSISRGAKVVSRHEDKGKSHSPAKLGTVESLFPIEGRQIVGRQRRESNSMVSMHPTLDFSEAYFNKTRVNVPTLKLKTLLS